jgi:formylglycine-generating enzyme required for sulfatase activity
MQALIESELEKTGAQREVDAPPPAPAPAPTPQSAAAPQAQPGNPFDEFRRMIRLSGLDSDLTDDQRDALCNMGENLGLTGGQAEDLIDEYIEEIDSNLLTPSNPQNRDAVAVRKPQSPTVSKAQPAQKPVEKTAPREMPLVFTPLARAQEKAKYPSFTNTLGLQMQLVTSGTFHMGSNAADAAPNERPVTPVRQTCFYIARFPVTNCIYEKFDSAHAGKRLPKAADDHPVVYVSSIDAVNFCQWLSARERKKYRLPTEAEWEYAARGLDGRSFPWGEELDRNDLANLADVNTTFPWRDETIDDGYAETSPVGAYPRGASPFGAEDMAGNVWEWCLDFFETYKGKERTNPRGPAHGPRRIYRGGSWKSRAASLRTTARGFNTADYSSNDVGFRIVCECE